MVILVGCGQCGNQLQYSIVDELYNQLNQEGRVGLDAYFRESGSTSSSSSFSSSGRPVARAVCLDTEPKVIERCVEQARNKGNGAWLYDARSTAFTHGGAGNNWAQGYRMCSGEFMDVSLNCVRRELEHTDWPSCLLMLNSLGGGTGSGFGTRMAEAVADEFPDTTRVNLVISPYHFGEVVVQNFNALLCLSKLSTCSHAVLTFENEVARDLCTTMRGIKSPSLHDVNRTIADHVLSVLLPRRHARGDAIVSLVDDVAHLCAHPGLKYLDVKMTPQTPDSSVAFTFDTWTSLLKTMERMSTLGVQSERGISRDLSRPLPPDQTCRSYASTLILRGLGAQQTARQFVEQASPSIAVHWSDKSTTYQRSAALLSNSQSVLPVLQRPIYKAAEMFRARAFLHQYTGYGLEDGDFKTAFQVLGQSIENYKAL